MKGTYCLIINCRGTERRIGSLGTVSFPPGFYVYVGSGFNSLEARIKRHLSSEKRRRWHIDHFLDEADVECVLYTTDKRKLECKVSEKLHGDGSIDKFGCSDCSCTSHLHHFKNKNDATESVRRAFMELGAEVHEWVI